MRPSVAEPVGVPSRWSAETPPRIAPEAVVRLSPETIEALFSDTRLSRARQWADQMARAIDELPHGLAFRLGEHTKTAGDACLLAQRIAAAVRDALVRRGAPASLEIENDVEQATDVVADRRYRTLLPHHDGGNASFLTPSRLDDPLFGPDQRRTRPPSVTTTRAHKMYQGFLLRAVGDFESVTTYYDLLAILRAAYLRQAGRDPTSVGHLARWTGANLRHALRLIETLGGTYVTLAGMLGSTNPTLCVTAVHRAEAWFGTEQTERYPELQAFNDADARGLSPSERLLDRALRDLMGIGWLSFRERYEVGIVGEAGDFIVGQNLTLLHGGWRGGRGRIIEPVCFTVRHPAGDDYERWLWAAWRRGGHRLERHGYEETFG